MPHLNQVNNLNYWIECEVRNLHLFAQFLTSLSWNSSLILPPIYPRLFLISIQNCNEKKSRIILELNSSQLSKWANKYCLKLLLLLVYIPKASGPIVSLSTLNVLLDSSMVLYFVINSSRLLEIRFHQSDYNVYFYYISEIFDLILPSSLLSSMNSFLLSLIFSSG